MIDQIDDGILSTIIIIELAGLEQELFFIFFLPSELRVPKEK